MKKVYIIMSVNFKVMDDIMMMSVFSTKEEAFKAALADVEQKDGKDIKIHGHTMEGHPTSTTRVTNHNSLGSDLGITYNSKWGEYPCARMIMEREIKE